MKTLILLFSLICLSHPVHAAEPEPATAQPSTEGEAVDVSKVTEKYWAQGKDTELGVVQNRKFTSAHRLELSVFAGTISTDPFLSVHHYGGSLGYYFSEYFSIHATAWKESVNWSDAYLSYQSVPDAPPLYTNKPKAFYGLELNQNILYGKASFFGKAIIYVDIFAIGGLGVTETETGNNFTPFLGIGQKIHLNQYLALHLDYRIMRFSEKLRAPSGDTQTRSNNTDAVTFGLSLFY